MTGEGGVASVTPARARWMLAVLTLVYAVNFIDRNILAILLQPIQDELRVSDTAMGVLTGFAFALFYTFAGIPIARLADRGSRRTVMAVGIGFWSLCTAASGLARSYAQLALARVGVGIGEASATPAAHSLISDAFPPERRTRAIAIYNMGASAGMFFGLGLGGWLQDAFGWRWAFAVVGLPGLAIALLVRFAMPEPARGGVEGRRDAAAEGVAATLRYLLAKRSFVHLCIAAGLYGVAAYGTLGWAPTLLRRVHGLSYAELGLQLAVVIGLGGAAGSYLGGALCDRLGRRDPRWQAWVPALCGVAVLPAFVAFVLSPDANLALAAFVPVNLLNVVFAAPTYALVQGLARLRMRALASALVLFVLNLIGLGAGPVGVGLCSDALTPRFGADALRYALLLAVVASLWGAVHSLLAARTLREDLAATARDERARDPGPGPGVA